LLRQCVNSLLL